jgi:glutamyl-Q tRNA(Asp) synthetase
LGADGQKLSKQDRARPVDRDDPIPALREAVEFLGVEKSGIAANIDSLLAALVERFDAANVRFPDNES